ncbi:unnamed protein product [Periconia digitata]|uniref:Uncharacterized protein n=1 Tax=Periconia digitata TaxID=1303443 RepID=A0A9W4UCB1_9PLEO|nr:unnamed protein product [Periconia digitata]
MTVTDVGKHLNLCPSTQMCHHMPLCLQSSDTQPIFPFRPAQVPANRSVFDRTICVIISPWLLNQGNSRGSMSH